MRATKAWFGARHSAWVTGDCGAMCGAVCADPDGAGVARVELDRWRSLGERRGARGRKVISDVRLRGAARGPDGRVHVEAEEALRLMYEIGSHTHHEQRTIGHRLVWERRGGAWRLVAHVQETEAWPGAGRKAASPPDAASSPDAGDPGTDALMELTDPAGDWSSHLLGGGAFAQPGDEVRAGYDPIRAYRYAEQWWNGRNPRFQDMGVDCTNFVSQVLYAGGYPMTHAKDRTNGWWYRFGRSPAWSFSWAGAHALAMHLRASREPFRTRLVLTPEELSLGDVICYDWQGAGQYGHSTVVVGHDPEGRPLVDAHTVDSHHRYYSYEDSYAWTPRTRYLFVHFEG